MRWLPRVRWLPRMRWFSRLCRMQRMQSLSMRRRLWRLRWLRRWLDRYWRAMDLMCRVLRILGPMPLVLGNDAF